MTAWLQADPAEPRQRRSGAATYRQRRARAGVFSAIPYKTPWNLLPFYAATIVAAGHRCLGAGRGRPPRRRGLTSCWLALLAIGSVHLGWQAWRASVVYAADPRNPYVYAQTVPDAVRMAARIRDLAALHADHEQHAGHR